MIRKRQSEKIDAIRINVTEARQSLDDIMMNGEFLNAFIEELKKEVPPFLVKFCVNRAFKMIRQPQGWAIYLYNHKDEGQLLAYWNFGVPEYDFPGIISKNLHGGNLRVKHVHMVIPGYGVRAGFHHDAINPDKFISRAWHRVLNRYTMRVKRVMDKALGGKGNVEVT